MSLSHLIFRVEQSLHYLKCRLLRQRHYLSFVEEFVMNPDFAGYVAGRIEVWGDGLWATREIRYFTLRSREFEDFRKRWDFKDVTAKQLAAVEKRVADEFYEEIT